MCYSGYCLTKTVTLGSLLALGPRFVLVTVIVFPSAETTLTDFPVVVPCLLAVNSSVDSSTCLTAVIVPEMTASPTTGTGLLSSIAVVVVVFPPLTVSLMPFDPAAS